MRFLFFIFFTLCTNVFSKSVQINPAAIFVSQQVRRGALIWEAPIMIVGPSFVFFDVLTLGGPGGLALQFQKEKHQYGFGLSWFDDSAPQGPVIELGSDEEDFKNLRKTTYETYFRYTYNQRGRFSFDFTLNKDLKNNGHYISMAPSFGVLPFFKLGTELGLGNTKQNRYLFGPEGKGGLTHYDFFANYMIPWLLPWQGMFMVRYTRSHVARGANRHAGFVRGRYTNGILFMGGFWSL